VIEIPDPRQDALGYKACCAALYESTAVRFLLGESMHPGGIELTREMLTAGGIKAGDQVLDVACGVADGRAAVESLGAVYYGVDLGLSNLSRAGSGRLAAAEAERLPFRDASFDAVMVQCAFCTFPDKQAAAAELARVLKPGGRLLLADVTLDFERIPPELDSVFATAACLADARPMPEYKALIEAAGLHVRLMKHCPEAAKQFLRDIDRKLFLIRIAQAVKAVELDGIDIVEARRLLKLGMEMVERGELSYGYVIAEKTA
jgi:arsenite methyltransferase